MPRIPHAGPRALIAFFLLLAGCASDRQVYVEVPITRLEPPTPAPRMLGIGLTSAAAARVELTPDQTTTTPTTDTPTIRGQHTAQAHFDIQPVPPIEISLRAFGHNVSGAQVKWLPVRPQPGEGGALAFTFAYGHGKSKFDFDGGNSPSHTTINQTMLDGAMILGWQFDDHFLLFGGPYYSHHGYDGSYSSTRGSNPDVNLDFEGVATARGGNVALAVTPAPWVQIAGEFSEARIIAGSSARNVGRGSVSIQFFFGPRLYPAGADASDRVKVVPPEKPG